jgi:ATP-dependent Clp protease ATP-binding subunit ClpC
VQITKTPTPRVERIWARAEEEAERRGHDHVGTEHLLLALSDDLEGAAGWLLLSLGMRDDLARELVALLDSPPVANTASSVA